MSSRVKITLGGPGCGKTTRLLSIVNDALEAGVDPSEIAFVSFTRKAAAEGRDRMAAKFGFQPSDMPFCKTLHSLAYAQGGFSSSEMMTTHHYKELGESIGMRFSMTFDDAWMFREVTAVGDKVAQIESLARARMRDLEQQWIDSGDRAVTWRAVELYARALRAYKKEKGVYDYQDIIDVCKMPLPVKLFILDESQDITASMWSLAVRLAKKAEQVRIAGDDRQAIFRWAGADVGYFLNLKGEREVLPVSHRLPREVFNVASNIAARISNKYEQDWRPRDEPGRVEAIVDPAQAPLSEGTWMLLARNSRHLDVYRAVVRAAGHPYTMHGRSSVDTPEVRAVYIWERLRRGAHVRMAEAETVCRFISDATVPTFEGEYSILDIAPTRANLDWMAALDLMRIHEREYIRAIKRNGESLTQPPRIHISTIHGVKGGECDHTMLLSDVSDKCYQNRFTDDEARVFYVGATRSKKSLWVVRPRGLKHYAIL